MASNPFKDGGQVGYFVLGLPGQHGTATDYDCGDVQSRRCHQGCRNGFVAVWNDDQRVKGMGNDHGLNGIRDQLPAGKAVLHAQMVHGNPVANRYEWGCKRRASVHQDAFLYRQNELVQVGMPRNDFIMTVKDAHQRPFNLLVGEAKGFEKRAVWRSLHTALHSGAFHFISPPTAESRTSWNGGSCRFQQSGAQALQP